jgi:hypothetical protein
VDIAEAHVEGADPDRAHPPIQAGSRLSVGSTRAGFVERGRQESNPRV